MGFLRGRVQGIQSLVVGTLGIAVVALSACGARTGLDPGELEPVPDAGPMCMGPKVQTVRVGSEQQMDLLFVIDNSASMADKQALLSDAVPGMVRRLANPFCISLSDPKVEKQVSSANEACPAGFRREFDPLTDLHIGVITSALGTAGGDDGDACATGPGHQLEDDQAHLVGTLDRALGVPTYQGAGFLAWDPLAQALPPGESDMARLEQNFRNLVTLSGETGCGFEQPLESFYRFLIDPNPPENILVNSTGLASPVGRDDVLLAQRARFLRADSLVAVVMLSDENDCSMLGSGQGWLVGKFSLSGQPFRFPRATAACDRDPNDACCRACITAEDKPPAGCARLKEDPSCLLGDYLDQDADRFDLRCYDQKRRFGIDLLYPTARYAVGLRNRSLCPSSIYHDGDCDCGAVKERARSLGLPPPPCTSKEVGAPVPNPLFTNLTSAPAFERDTSQVFLAGIVGVPWQDLATPETLNDPARLEYLTAGDLARLDARLGFTRWQLILGDPVTYTAPLDPFMHESPEPRSGTNPLTGDRIVGPESTNPRANAINGHERLTDNTGLQYACTFQLKEPRPCMTGSHCDCDSNPDSHSDADSVCQPPSGGIGGDTQYYAKAYPGLRELDVLKQHGDNAVVASICPKVLSGGEEDLGFGYRPALSGLVKRIHCTTLNGRFESDPASGNYGSVDCRILAVRQSAGTCACDGVARREVSASDLKTLKADLLERGSCGGNTGLDCNNLCICEVPQTAAAALRACQSDPSLTPVDPDTNSAVEGWCYVAPEQGFGVDELVNQCPAGRRQNVRFLGAGTPAADEHLFALCGDPCK